MPVNHVQSARETDIANGWMKKRHLTKKASTFISLFLAGTLLFAAFPWTPMMSFAAESAYLVLSPATASPGQTISINGYDFDSDLRLVIYFDSASTDIVVYTDSAGSFTDAQFTIPSDANAGDHTITVKYSIYANTERTQADATLRVEGTTPQSPAQNNTPASVTLTPDRGAAGTKVTISGMNFDPSTRLTIYFDGKSTGVSDYSKNDGTFGPTSFTVPSISAGTYEVSVQGSLYANTAKTKATALFAVTGTSSRGLSPVISLSQSTGFPGDSITVTANGFGSSQQLDIYFDQANIVTSKTDSKGVAKVTIKIPDSATSGLHVITVKQQSDLTVEASASFTVNIKHQDVGGGTVNTQTSQALLSVSPLKGPAGSTITIKGSGFDSSISLSIIIDDSYTGVKATTDSSGKFTAEVVIPTGTPVGNHVIIAQEGTYANSPTTKAAANFEVTKGVAPPPSGGTGSEGMPGAKYAYLVLDPSSGSTGQQISIKGFNFDPFIELKIAIDDAQTDVKVTTDSSGKFQVSSFTIPVGLEKGDHTITALYSIYANTVHTKGAGTFTVTSSPIPEGIPSGTNAAIAFTPNKAPQGGAVTLTGVRFEPNIAVWLYVDDVRTDLLINTDSTGSFVIDTIVPNFLSVGDHTVTVQANQFANTIHTKAFTQFTVLEGVVFKPKISLSPSSGSEGTVVQVTGEGFSSASAFKATFGNIEVPLIGVSGSLSGDSIGSYLFGAKFVVPKLNTNTKVSVKITDASQFSASATFDYKTTTQQPPDGGGQLTDFPQGAATSYVQGEPIITDVPIKVNILLMGFPEDKIDEDIIRQQLLSDYTQIDRILLIEKKTLIQYASYKFDYEIKYVPDNVAAKYVEFIAKNHEEKTVVQADGSEFLFWSVDAGNAEEWLKQNVRPPEDGFTLIVVDNQDASNYSLLKQPYYYDGNNPDPDTGMNPGGNTYGSANFMIGYGGNYRFHVLDLSAGPTFYQSTTLCMTLINIYDQLSQEAQDLCNSMFNAGVLSLPTTPDEQETADFLSGQIGFYARTATVLRFVPSFLYHPNIAGDYLVDIKIFSDDATRQYSNYINKELVKESLTLLEPRATFTVNVEEMPLNSYPELKQVVVGALVDNGEIDSAPVKKFFQQKLRELSPSSFVRTILPIYVIGGYHFTGGTLGMAADDGNGNFGFVLMALDRMLIDESKFGLTNTAVHESAHAFGLTHPHDGFDPEVGEIGYWPYDFSTSIVTYATNNNLPDRLDYDNRDRAATLLVLNQTSFTLKATKTLLEQNGFTNTPKPLSYRVQKSLEEYDMAISLYKDANPDYYAASTHALSAWQYALSSLLTVPSDPSQPIEGDFRVVLPDGQASDVTIEPGAKKDVNISIKRADASGNIVSVAATTNNDDNSIWSALVNLFLPLLQGQQEASAATDGADEQLELYAIGAPLGLSVSFEKESGTAPFDTKVIIEADPATAAGTYNVKIFAQKGILLDDVLLVVTIPDRGQGTDGPGGELFPSEEEPLQHEQTIFPKDTVVYYDIPAPGAVQPYKIATDPAGNAWFSERNYNRIDMLNPVTSELTRWGRSGQGVTDVVAFGNYVYYGYSQGIVRFDISSSAGSSFPMSADSWGVNDIGIEAIAISPDGRYVWFVSAVKDIIGKLDTQTDAVSLWTLPTEKTLLPVDIAIDPVAYSKGNDLVWITEQDGNALASFDGLTLTEYKIPESGAKPTGVEAIEIDDKSTIWLTEQGTGKVTSFDTESASFTRYKLPMSPSTPGFTAMEASESTTYSLVFSQNEGRIARLFLAPGASVALEGSTSKPEPIVSKLKATELDAERYSVQVDSTDLEVLPISPRTSQPLISGNEQSGSLVQWDLKDGSLLPFATAIDKDDNIWFTTYRANSIGYISSGKGGETATFIEGNAPQVVKDFLAQKVVVTNLSTNEVIKNYKAVQTVPDKYAEQVLGIKGQYVTTIAFQDRYGRAESNGDLNVFLQISHTDTQVNSARGVELGGDNIQIKIAGSNGAPSILPKSGEINLGVGAGSEASAPKSQDTNIKLTQGLLPEVIKELLDSSIDVLNKGTGEKLTRYIHVQTLPDKYAAQVHGIEGQYVTTIAFQDRYGRAESNGDLNVFLQISHTDTQVNSARGVQLGGDSIMILIRGTEVGEVNKTLEIPLFG